MSDDKLIRLSDAITALRSADLPFGYGHAAEVIRAIPAVQVEVKPLRYIYPKGETLDEIREHARQDPLAQEGDMKLVWVNEGDLYNHALPILTAQPSPDEHYDDYCIGQFAKMMSEKMAASRAKGRSGWNDPEKCSVEYLRSLLYEHLDKGDPVDVANFCMMLRHYEASTYREACNCQPNRRPRWRRWQRKSQN